MAPAEVEAIVQQARQVYAHFGEEPPAPKKLRQAMITLEFLTEVAQRLLGPEQTINSQASVLIKGLLFLG